MNFAKTTNDFYIVQVKIRIMNKEFGVGMRRRRRRKK